jgi:hypothetical protein
MFRKNRKYNCKCHDEVCGKFDDSIRKITKEDARLARIQDAL